MKLLKKQALATTSNSISQYDVSNSEDTHVISYCLRTFAKLTRILCLRFNQKITDARTSLSDPIKHPYVIDWAPLIKASSVTGKQRTFDKTRQHSHSFSLSGRSVLCVGGRIKFYPVYEQLIKSSGGNLVTFHGNSNDRPDNLSRMLREVDMIICPVDCVNHEDFFAVKYYCQYSGKPCVLLDRSEVNTFIAGIHTLIHMTTLRL